MRKPFRRLLQQGGAGQRAQPRLPAPHRREEEGNDLATRTAGVIRRLHPALRHPADVSRSPGRHLVRRHRRERPEVRVQSSHAAGRPSARRAGHARRLLSAHPAQRLRYQGERTRGEGRPDRPELHDRQQAGYVCRQTHAWLLPAVRPRPAVHPRRFPERKRCEHSHRHRHRRRAPRPRPLLPAAV